MPAQPYAEATAGVTASLVDRIRAGDASAEVEFVRQYQHGVRGLVRRHTRPGESMVDDFVQEVLSGVLEKLRQGELRDAAALPAYVRSAIVRITQGEYRRRSTRGESVSTEALERIPGDSEPSENLRAEQRATHVRTMLAELPVPRDRAVLVRFYLDERSKEDVCAELGIDPDHFRRVLFRARERLRELLAGAEGL